MTHTELSDELEMVTCHTLTEPRDHMEELTLEEVALVRVAANRILDKAGEEAVCERLWKIAEKWAK